MTKISKQIYSEHRVNFAWSKMQQNVDDMAGIFIRFML